MKRKVISIILIILLLTCGGLAIYGVTKRPVGSMPSTGNADQQIAASEKAEDQMTLDDGTAATQEATATPATPSPHTMTKNRFRMTFRIPAITR